MIDMISQCNGDRIADSNTKGSEVKRRAQDQRRQIPISEFSSRPFDGWGRSLAPRIVEDQIDDGLGPILPQDTKCRESVTVHRSSINRKRR